MVDLAEIQAVYYMVAATGVLVAAGYYILNMRATQRNMKANLETRQTQLFMELYSVLRSKDFVKDTRELADWHWEDFKDFRKKYGQRTNKEANSVLISVGNFFDGIGLLVKRDLIKTDLVDDLMSSWVIWYWEKFGTIIKDYRKDAGPNYMEWVEYLYNRILTSKGTPPKME